MGKTVAVSFEGGNVKVVHASLKGKRVTIERSETIPESEFDNYLRREKATEFIVTSEFKESYHDVITTPVVKNQFLKKIIESEIRKVIIQKEFSFIYASIGEKVIENKRVLEVFYYAVPKDLIRNTIERFYNNGKIVRAVYPSVFSAASLFDSQISGEAQMGVFSSGKSRIVFFTKRGVVYFLRNYESYETELSDFDIQNINMTISYCFQNIRINPSAVFLMGAFSESSRNNAMSTAPLACLSIPEYIHCTRETFNEFIIPVASYFTHKSSNIMTQEFREIYLLKNYMTYASRVFIMLVLLCIGAISFELKNAAEKKDRIKLAKKSRVDTEKVLSELSAREEKIGQYMPLVEFLNKPEPDFQKLLIPLGETDFGNLTLNMVNASVKGDNTLSISLNGVVHADTYSAMQDSLDHMINELRKMKNMEITNKSVELKDKTFILEMNFKTAE
ncbi:MAG: hypothetical protein HZB30_12435 [Nitrospirae bacterium]|nr:hypothetical protein [Nitrospirota bacterium]